MKKLVLVLVLLAAPAFAQTFPDASAWGWHHAPTPTPTPPPTIVECQPGLAPGAICRWPAYPQIVDLFDEAGNLAQRIALVSGPQFVPLDPRASLLSYHVTVDMSWWICPPGEPAGSWGGGFWLEASCWVAP